MWLLLLLLLLLTEIPHTASLDSHDTVPLRLFTGICGHPRWMGSSPLLPPDRLTDCQTSSHSFK